MPARLRRLSAFLLMATLVACKSPEATRVRGGGPGGDPGNRRAELQMHEGSKPYANTPQIITVQHPPLEPAQQAATGMNGK